jgi:hypothetical protein
MSMWSDLIDPGTAPLVGATITAAVSINSLFAKWLIDNFKHLRQEIKDLAQLSTNQLDQHEMKDQTRHEENLYRFERISVALARLGSENGTYDGKSLPK